GSAGFLPPWTCRGAIRADERLPVGLRVDAELFPGVGFEAVFARVRAVAVHGQGDARLPQGVALRGRVEGEGRRVHARLFHQGLVVEQGDRVPDLRDAPEAAVAGVEVHHGLLPLARAVGDDLVDVQQRVGVLELDVVRGVHPVDVRRVAAGDVQ